MLDAEQALSDFFTFWGQRVLDGWQQWHYSFAILEGLCLVAFIVALLAGRGRNSATAPAAASSCWSPAKLAFTMLLSLFLISTTVFATYSRCLLAIQRERSYSHKVAAREFDIGGLKSQVNSLRRDQAQACQLLDAVPAAREAQTLTEKVDAVIRSYNALLQTRMTNSTPSVETNSPAAR